MAPNFTPKKVLELERKMKDERYSKKELEAINRYIDTAYILAQKEARKIRQETGNRIHVDKIFFRLMDEHKRKLGLIK